MVSLPGISLLFLFFSDSFPFRLIHYMLPHSPFSCLFSPLFLYVLFSLTVLVTVAWERVNGEFHTSFLIFCLEIGHTPCPHTSTDTANHRSIPNFKMDVLLDERDQEKRVPGEEDTRCLFRSCLVHIWVLNSPSVLKIYKYVFPIHQKAYSKLHFPSLLWLLGSSKSDVLSTPSNFTGTYGMKIMC